ncbi:MAG: MarR family transcriptional regulator [Candidatus Delongbacteria bacterium]|jgi:DNA-binding MarR family transcriptional regulator|nr:MarR family transcriptional regulator [Candidatus Delongbacteria bacterium]
MSNYIFVMTDPEYIITFMTMIRSKANNMIVAEFKKNNITGIAPSHAAILNFLYKSKIKLRMVDIAEQIQRDKSTLTVLVNKLVKLGYVKRERSDEDSRITYIVLTKKALELKPTFTRIARLMIKTAFKDFDQKEQKLLMDKLGKLYNNY